MSIPKQPRQQMINLMYLVLTALLALNVSSEVLNAFKLINDKLGDSNAASEAKSASLMSLFKMKYNSNETKTKPYIEDANRVRDLVLDFYSYTEELKAIIIDESGGMEKGKMVGHKNTEVPTRIMIDQNRGRDLEIKIEKLKENLLSLTTLGDDYRVELQQQIALSTNYDRVEAQKIGKKSWASFNFERVPVIAAVTMLSKLQSDAKEAEARIIEKLYATVDFDTYKFEDLSARVISPNAYVLAGRQEYNASIFFAGTSKTQEVEMFIGKFKTDIELHEVDGSLKNKVMDFPLQDGFTRLEVKDGAAFYKETPGSTGNQQRQGVIKIKKPDGSGYNYFPFELEYQSAQPAVVVAPEKINVMYAGVDNPLSISVPGFPADKVRAYLIGNGRLTGSNGSYSARMNQVGTAKVEVNVVNDAGVEMKMSTMTFRVKRVPNPDPQLDGLDPGRETPATIKVRKRVNVVMRDFEWEPQFRILGFDCTYQPKNDDLVGDYSTSAQLTPKMLRWLEMAKPGDAFYFENIKIVGPDSLQRKLPEMVFRIK